MRRCHAMCRMHVLVASLGETAPDASGFLLWPFGECIERYATVEPFDEAMGAMVVPSTSPPSSRCAPSCATCLKLTRHDNEQPRGLPTPWSRLLRDAGIYPYIY